MSRYEKLVDLNTRNVACVLFPNSNKLSVEEITEIFSEYGNVLSVNCCGSEAGMRFVRYRTKEEAMRAAIGLDGHRSIQLIPVRGKRKENNESQDRSNGPYNERKNGQAEKADSSSQRSGYNQSPDNHTGKNKIDLGRNSNYPKNTDDGARRGRDLNPTGQSVNSRLNRNSQSHENYSQERTENLCQNNSRLAQLHKLRGTNANTFQPLGTLATNGSAAQTGFVSSVIVRNTQLSNDSTTEESGTPDAPPPLIAGVPSGPGPKSIEKEKAEIVLASDVIVANIHSNIGVSNIYEMLWEYKPIYVSDIETVPDINVRFCYVYFESQINALKAERSFDGFSVCGQNIIALRSNRLEAETGIYRDRYAPTVQ